ncbi:hypothetical protein [Blastomonas sp.]|uniref:hypothetical protein n=1 Tax=Blastomonas sp. TaxID=1909299 RepID=UPI002637537E|nr:hypothetical protein [Blastomonas sp.]MDM7957513.1 hypothetical protein [Blastomonas sp.]
MKVFAIPTICGAFNAVGSLVFFGFFAYFYGDPALARLALVQAVIAMAQMVMVPQCWLYVLSGVNNDELEQRYWAAVVLEVICYLSGLVVLLGFACLPLALVVEHRMEALFFYCALGLSAMTSHQGFFRARHDWFSLAAWMLLPTATRLVLLTLSALDVVQPMAGLQPAAWFVLLYFLVPEALRFLVINLPRILPRISRIRVANIKAAARSVAHNWLYDMGSGFCENIDKVFVGLLVNPAIFVVYFFARRIGNGISIVMEPYFAEMYRRLVTRSVTNARNYMQKTLFLGNVIGLGVAVLGSALILILRDIEFIRTYIPPSVAGNWWIFFIIVIGDGGVAGSRWSRFVFQGGRISVTFLLVRIALKFLFAAGLLLNDLLGGYAVAIMFILIWLLEYAYVAARARGLDRYAETQVNRAA